MDGPLYRAPEERAMTADAYGGIIGAFPYAFRQSRSRTFRIYAIIASIVTIVGSLIFGAGVIELLAESGRTEGTTGFVRGFYLLVGVFALAPLVTPVLLVARRHRRSEGPHRRYDTTMALAGLVYVALLYVGLVASVPPERQQPLHPILLTLGDVELRIDLPVTIGRFLYDLPRITVVLFPLLGAVLVWVVHRYVR
jgi:hypothetical protein